MTETLVPSEGYGLAAVRAANAMIQSLGGSEVFLLLPQMGMPEDPSAQLGLVDPGVEQIRLCPVISRNLATESTGPRRRVEFLVPAAAVANHLALRGITSGTVLFDGALGVLRDSDLFHIEGVATEYFAGTVYLYRITAVE